MGWTGKKCTSCNGTGEDETEGRRACTGCGGTGEAYISCAACDEGLPRLKNFEGKFYHPQPALAMNDTLCSDQESPDGPE